MTGGAGRPVTVVKRRWETSSNGTSTFPATVIDDDEAGVWFRTEPLTMHRNGDGRVVYISTHTWLGLVPRDRMWLAMFAGGNWKVDVCLPPTVTHTTIEFCDLELDVDVRTPRDEHTPRIVDQEEFEALGLAADLAARCEQVALDVQRAIAEREVPFGDALEARIARVVEADPLVHAGELVRASWIAPYNAWAEERLREQFGRLTLGERVLLAGARGEIHAVVDETGVVAQTDTPDARAAGLETLVDLTLQAAGNPEAWSSHVSYIRA